MTKKAKGLAWLAVIGSLLAGGLTATQSFINGQLGQQLDNGILAAWISFTGGLVVIALVYAFTPSAQRGARELARSVRSRELPWWMLLGGFAGAAYVFTQGLTVGVIGVALFTLGVVAGQVTASMVFDRIGIGPAGKLDVSWVRVVGAVLAVLAVGVAVWSRVSDVSGLWLVLFPLIGGVIVAWQMSVNGHVNRASGSGVATAGLNFLVGTLALTLAAVVSVFVQGMPAEWPTDPWLYAGGPFGLIFIALASYFVRVMGALLIGMSSIAGQLLASLLIDALAPAEGAPLGVGLFIGAALALLALLVAGWRELKSD